jgi:membrane associated rhomboid family serine protease
VPLPLRWQIKLDRARAAVKRFFQSDPSAGARPRMCPSCGTLVGTTATKCHACGANVRFGMAAASRSLGRLLPQAAPVTYAMMSLCCLFYGISLLLTVRMGTSLIPEGGGLSAIFDIGAINSIALQLLGASLPIGYTLFHPWRFVTAVFLHGNLLHIAFNMWVLMDVGPIVEDLYGSSRYLFFYVFTGAIGYVFSSAIGHFSIGASGALMGLIGLLIAATTRRGDAAAKMIRSNLIKWVIYIFVLGFMIGSTDNMAHLGGLVSGFLIGKIVADRQPTGAAEQKRADALGWATAFILLLCFGLMVREFLQNR